MTMKKKLLTTLSVVLILGLAAMGIVAFMIDTDSDDNYMAVGNVNIEQEEDFVQGSPLDPGVTVDKKVTVTNVGKSDAYVRTWFAFEMPMDGVITPNWNAGVDPEELGVQTIEGTKYMIYVAEYGKMAKDDAVTSLLSVTMEPSATNDDVAKYGDNYDILVFSQAMQVAGFENNEAAAWAAEFGEATLANHPWPAKVDTADELTTALQAGGPVQLTDDVTVSKSLTLRKDANIDMNGNDIVAATSSAAVNVTAGTTVNIEGEGTITNANATAVLVYGTCNIDGATVENTRNTGEALLIQGGGKVVMNDGEIIGESDKGGSAINVKGSFELNGGLVEGKAAGTAGYSNAIVGSGTGTITINGGTIKAAGTAIEFPNGVVEVNGGTIDAGYYALRTRYANVNGVDVNIKAGTALVHGYSVGTLYAGNAIYNGIFEAPVLLKEYAGAAELTVYGGAFNVDPTAYIASGKTVTENSGVFTVN